MDKNYMENCKKRRCPPDTTSNVQPIRKTICRECKRTLLYLYKLKTEDLLSNESRDHHQEDGYLVPSPRCGF